MPTDIMPTNEDGLPHGYWKIYNSIGELSHKGEYINGEANGCWEYLWWNGNPMFIGTYLNGKEVGLWVEYNENGTITEKVFHAN